MLARIFSCTVLGIEGIPLEVEVDIHRGMPAFEIIGLPDPSVKEARERVRAAVRNSGYSFPSERITVNLAPADLRKEGPAFDLAIAVGVLAASRQIPYREPLRRAVLVGELSLDGALRPVPGTLAMAASIAASERLGECVFYIPAANGAEAALITQLPVKGVHTLKEAAQHFGGALSIPTVQPQLTELVQQERTPGPDLSEVKGQETAKRALEVAAAGNHNLLLYGPPGSGKTMLARRLPGILPAPTLDEILEITRIHSIAGRLPPERPLVTQRPFRSPHHGASAAGVIGGGRVPRPGEVSLAHRGVLFFDELPEYNRDLLEALRQPLEDRVVTVTRVSATLTYPADFMFVASANPCPCGFLNDPFHLCRCSPAAVQRYRSRLSGPLLDRIDLQVEVPRINFEQLQGAETGEDSTTIRRRVEQARQVQQNRFGDMAILTNAQMSSRHLGKLCPLSREARRLLQQAYRNLGLSMRAHDRIIKVARTIADLAAAETIEAPHIAEAIQYRSLDRD
ncbi:MAG: YifB family Mg chelatase-like AAA ATPase [Firmicutes bacterium]|jgi:magnesium chelatase family protein|nr:YifB family Mg chelatase-like AAA ATPase [Bacillota bacterium]